MKITAIDVIGLRADHDAPDSGSESCVVEVRTDSGLSGIAESASAACLVHAAIEGQAGSRIYPGLASLVMGREPLDIEALWQHMYRSNRFIGRRGAVIHGISAIDTALWDLKGKAEGVAVADLLGGPKRDRLRAYGTVWPTGNSVDDLRRNIDRGLALGLREIKLCATPEWAADPALTATLANAARAHVGDDVALYLDGTEKWPTAAAAAEVIPALAEAGFGWFEAPLCGDDVEGYGALQGLGLPIAGGDTGLTTRYEFAPMIDTGRVDIAQPDITVVGGFSEVRHIADMVDEQGRRMIMHGYQSNILLACNMQVQAAWPADEPVEYSVSLSPLRWELTNEKLEVGDDGRVARPEGPGLGVSLNRETVERYRVSK
ncbi:MAG: mandelate racemase/muconate lactonizing enzyme family protein [Alphaproteobacteria bacterium]|jgi:L-alanine-DL-glutamate epimerase-like enolase superfamily enzyme